MGQLAIKYRRRIEKVRKQSEALKYYVMRQYVEGLQECTIKELYVRTPLPVSYALMRSIGGKVVWDTVAVGYNLSSEKKVPYASRRINLTGISPSGHHILDMHPSAYLRKHVDPKVRAVIAKVKSGMMDVPSSDGYSYGGSIVSGKDKVFDAGGGKFKSYTRR